MRVKTQHIILPNAPAVLDLPLRRWRMEICLLDQNDNEIEANILSSCTYYLHPTFKDPIRQIAAPPFALEEEGWGQFDLKIICQFIENAGKFTIKHALLFGDDAYASCEIVWQVNLTYLTMLFRTITKSSKILSLQTGLVQFPCWMKMLLQLLFK